MNPLTNVKNITKLNEIELAKGTKKSWHDIYKDSAWIFIGGLAYDLTEGDVLTVFSQYGEIVNINLIRDKKTGKPKGYCFLCYANQKSTVLAVDNFNGIKLCNRTIRVDHVANYKPPKEDERDDEITKKLKSEGCAPQVTLPEKKQSDDVKVKREKKKKKVSVKRDPMLNDGLFEGDIYGIPADGDRNAVPRDDQLWPGGVVPYVISPEREDMRDVILQAMKHIEHFSCVRFKEREGEQDYVKIIKNNGCYSAWGRTGGEQPLSLGDGCNNFAIALHEILHAIGFEHEHNRSDRDDYLIINWDNIWPQWIYAFRKLRPDQNRILTQFDMSSIMLYGSRSFAKEYEGENYSMVFRDGRVIPDIYDRKSMSVLDSNRINMLYKCPEEKLFTEPPEDSN